jgi:predicted anti-sigma-YlaC factor YlaD
MSKHDHTECKDLLGFLSDYVDGCLGAELCLEIEPHLQECQNCRIVIDTLRKTISLYRESAANPTEIPSPVKERLYRTLNLEDYLH